MKQKDSERLTAWTVAILRIIEDKKALLRSPAAATHVPALACHRWQLTKAFCNYRWFIKSVLASRVRNTGHDLDVSSLIVAVDDVHEILRGYVLHWSNGDNVCRWPDYQAAATATLDEIAATVRRISDETAALLRAAPAIDDRPAPRSPDPAVAAATAASR